MAKIVISDLDGVIADITHRKHLLDQKDINWETFEMRSRMDPPKKEIIWLLNMLYHRGTQVYIFTGRSEGEKGGIRELTVDWLERRKVKYNKLFMRPFGDRRPDFVLKREWLKTIPRQQVLFALDDRYQNILMYNRMNIETLFVGNSFVKKFSLG